MAKSALGESYERRRALRKAQAEVRMGGALEGDHVHVDDLNDERSWLG